MKTNKEKKVDLSVWGFIVWLSWFLILIISAIGQCFMNNNIEIISYPSSYYLDNIISVMSTDHNDDVSVFSNYGSMSVDLAAHRTRNREYRTLADTVFVTFDELQ